ncbi:type IV pilin protein [Candidatus Omnitrophota bacterium]
MMKALRNKKGFTMIELMIVAIIVAILAVVLIPLMSGNRNRAYATEAEATLGTIRTALRAYQAENNGDFPDIGATGVPVLVTAAPANTITFSVADLTGTYFDEQCFFIESDQTAGTYEISADWDAAANDAPQEDKLDNLAFSTTLDQDGAYGRSGY